MMEMLLAPAFIAAALLALALSGLIWWRGTRPVAADPSCGKCGYNTIGLPSNVCPECGSDLQEVGIAQPGAYRNLSAGNRIAIWSLLMPLAAFVISISLVPYAPRETTIWRSVAVSAPANPGGCDQIMIRYANDTTASPFQWMQIWVDRSSKTAICTIDREGSYFVSTPRSDDDEYRQGDRVDLSVILGLLQSIGVDTTDAQARKDAQSVLDFVGGMVANQKVGFQIEGYRSVSTDGGIIGRAIPEWVGWLTGLIWILLWIAGAWFVGRTARRPNTRAINYERGRVLESL